MRINSAGNVGVGTDSPDAKLEVVGISGAIAGTGMTYLNNTDDAFSLVINNAGTSAQNDRGVFDARVGGSSVFRINNSGNVGIGTDSPVTKLMLEHNNDGAVGGTIRIKDRDSQQVAGQLTGAIEFESQDATIPTSGVSTAIKAFSASSTGGSYLTISTTDINTSTLDERMRITSSGQVLFNGISSLPSAAIHGGGYNPSGVDGGYFINSTDRTTTWSHFLFYNSNGLVGNISTNGSATSYTTSSDYRLKEDLQDFAGLNMVSKIPVYDFKWKTDESRSYGVMAHELQDVLPDAVTGEKDAEEMQGVDYSKIVPLLIKSIQELTAKVERLEAK
jgi:hypothetical protein